MQKGSGFSSEGRLWVEGAWALEKGVLGRAGLAAPQEMNAVQVLGVPGGHRGETASPVLWERVQNPGLSSLCNTEPGPHRAPGRAPLSRRG